MKADTAKLMTVLGVGTAVVGTTIKEVLDGHHAPSFYVPLAGAIVAIPLLIVSDFQPDLAGGFALMVFVAAWVYSGQSIVTAINNATGKNANNPASRTITTPTSRIG